MKERSEDGPQRDQDEPTKKRKWSEEKAYELVLRLHEEGRRPNQLRRRMVTDARTVVDPDEGRRGIVKYEVDYGE